MSSVEGRPLTQKLYMNIVFRYWWVFLINHLSHINRGVGMNEQKTELVQILTMPLIVTFLSMPFIGPFLWDYAQKVLFSNNLQALWRPYNPTFFSRDDCWFDQIKFNFFLWRINLSALIWKLIRVNFLSMISGCDIESWFT